MTSLHRLLVPGDLLMQTQPELPPEAARHLKVVRPREGEEIELFDGAGRWRRYVWRTGQLQAQTETATAETPQQSLTLFACITKGSRWDWTIEKATELGVTRIVPVLSERTIVRIAPEDRAGKRARWMRIAEEAARQSDARWLPAIEEAVTFADSLRLVSETRCLIGALTSPPSPPIGQAEGNAVYIGPEGDFTPEELSALMRVATPVSFGPSVLRAETAAIFALSVLKGKMI